MSCQAWPTVPMWPVGFPLFLLHYRCATMPPAPCSCRFTCRLPHIAVSPSTPTRHRATSASPPGLLPPRRPALHRLLLSLSSPFSLRASPFFLRATPSSSFFLRPTLLPPRRHRPTLLLLLLPPRRRCPPSFPPGSLSRPGAEPNWFTRCHRTPSLKNNLVGINLYIPHLHPLF